MRQLSCKLAAQIAREVVGFWDKVDKVCFEQTYKPFLNSVCAADFTQRSELEQQLGEYVTIYWNAVLT